MRVPLWIVGGVVALIGAAVGCAVIEVSKTSESARAETVPAAATSKALHIEPDDLQVVTGPRDGLGSVPQVIAPETKSEPAPKPVYAIDAILALRSVREKSSVEFLVTAAEILEAGLDSVQTTEALTAVHATLKSLTAKEFKNAAAWRAWWTERGPTFVIPKADLSHWDAITVHCPPGDSVSDEAYGYTVRRPQAENWTIEKPDYDGPRVALMYDMPWEETIGNRYPIARAYFSVLPAKQYASQKAPKAFVEWKKKEVFAQQLDTHEKPLDVSEMRFGGATWTVIKGKGDGIGLKRGWGTMERRMYIAQIGAGLLYIDAFVRLGAERGEIDTLWKAVESTVVEAKK